ncbi:hypothetical protein E2C01_039901 [Portunus trituberculatus]|uniref:Uncharacterized protein n=1 Tax=Portunus trituberculatus TaxID=210409 RepID=A0A5B7FLW2_PORTR|nr:hypothetical protein [Portunus trituberculatus]
MPLETPSCAGDNIPQPASLTLAALTAPRLSAARNDNDKSIRTAAVLAPLPCPSPSLPASPTVPSPAPPATQAVKSAKQ